MSRNLWLRAAAVVAIASGAAACSRPSDTPANTASAAPPPAAAAPAPAGVAVAEPPDVITTPASMPAPKPPPAIARSSTGPLQAFSALQPVLEVRTYDTWDFWVADGAAHKSVPKSGQVCEQIYRLKPGTTRLSGLEIMSNYEQSMAAAGAVVTNPWRAHDDDLYVKLTKGGAVYWVEISASNGDTVTVHEIGMVPFTRTLQAPSGDDFHLLGHMPQTTPRPPVKTNYDEVSFDVANGTGTKPVKVRGYHYKMIYDLPSDRHLSGLESQLNYRAALKDLGAQILYADPGESPGETTARLNDGGKTVWISVTSNAAVTVDTLEEKPLQLTVTPPKAADMKTALDRDGHVTLYINFDFNKATLKPDAAPIIAQIVALLKANPTLKLSVDGYTDGVGLHDYNVKLSQARAAAVVAALRRRSRDRRGSPGLGRLRPRQADRLQRHRRRPRQEPPGRTGQDVGRRRPPSRPASASCSPPKGRAIAYEQWRSFSLACGGEGGAQRRMRGVYRRTEHFRIARGGGNAPSSGAEFTPGGPRRRRGPGGPPSPPGGAKGRIFRPPSDLHMRSPCFKKGGEGPRTVEGARCCAPASDPDAEIRPQSVAPPPHSAAGGGRS